MVAGCDRWRRRDMDRSSTSPKLTSTIHHHLVGLRFQVYLEILGLDQYLENRLKDELREDINSFFAYLSHLNELS